jgi:hypothetical protein
LLQSKSKNRHFLRFFIIMPDYFWLQGTFTPPFRQPFPVVQFDALKIEMSHATLLINHAARKTAEKTAQAKIRQTSQARYRPCLRSLV